MSPDGIDSLPKIEFTYIETEYEPYGDIIRNICLGMRARNAVNQDVLTYAGSKDPCYKDRREKASCRGCCKGAVIPYLTLHML